MNSTRRHFLTQCGRTALGTLSLTFVSRAISATPKPKPNIVFFLVDDLGWADAGCYGNSFNETPNIDRLATQGMRFTDAYAACPVCSPTRASILSGQYPARLGLTDFISGHWRPYEKLRVPINRQQQLPLETISIPEVLKTAGYTSGAFGKWHLGGKGSMPEDHGFDTAVVTSGWGHFGNNSQPNQKWTKEQYLAEELTNLGEQFIEANRERPFFLYLSHFAVHIPLEARQDKVAKYEKKPKPKEGINNPVYAAMLEHVDDSLGRIMKKLDDLDLADNTLLVFFSDNGGLRQIYTGDGPLVTSNAPLRAEKGTLYEGGIREPLIVRWPGVVKPNSKSDALVSSVDLHPTFAEIAGIKVPEDYPLDGQSIVPVLSQKQDWKDRSIYWHYPHYHHSTPASAIREGDWKLLEFFEDERLELYNLKADIGETRNLAGQQKEKAQALLAKLEAWRESVRAELPIPNQDYDAKRAHEWGKNPGRA